MSRASLRCASESGPIFYRCLVVLLPLSLSALTHFWHSLLSFILIDRFGRPPTLLYPYVRLVQVATVWTIDLLCIRLEVTDNLNYKPILKGNRREEASQAPSIGTDLKYTAIFRSRFLVLVSKHRRLKVAQSRPWALPFSAQQPVWVTP